jgi:hypothetical protein
MLPVNRIVVSMDTTNNRICVENVVVVATFFGQVSAWTDSGRTNLTNGSALLNQSLHG